MPIYEYRCRHCSGDFEKYVPSPRTAVACPSCASDDVTRKLSVFGMRAGDTGSVATMPSGGGGGCCGGGCGCH
jgi:putative FmdB family regulatory protein